MKRTQLKRAVSLVLAVIMIIGILPTVSFAAETNAFVSETHDVISRTKSNIAPGVTQDIVYAYAKDGKQMVYYVATADINRDDVAVYANYKDNQCTDFGMQKLREQMAAAQAKHSNPDDTDNYIPYYAAVAGVNADFYNMTTGQPLGAFVMEGHTTNGANNRPFFAILKDGTPVIGANNTDWNPIADQVAEAVGGSVVLLKDGVDVSAAAGGNYNTDRHSRTCVGYTAEGKVVLMVLDGRQEPFSCGGTMKELAQIMLEAGCVAAINLDGGGSTTFAARQEGANDVTVVNRPSDGSERSISSSLMIVSTAVPSDVFDRAVLTAEHSHVTPGSEVSISAVGVSPAGTSAEIPENAVYNVADAAMGSVSGNVFTASESFTGEAVVQMLLDGQVVGSTTIHVVIPDAIAFTTAQFTVPFGKTVKLDLTATHGLNRVALKPSDIVYTLSEPAIGTMSGMDFTAVSEDAASVTASAVSATLVFDKEVTATTEILLGKGSEVIVDFEDGKDAGLMFSCNPKDTYNYTFPESDQRIVTAETGKVHSGTNALAMHVNYSNSMESGYQKVDLRITDAAVFENAVRVGMWIYIPDEAVGIWPRWTIKGITGYADDGSIKVSSINGQDLDGVASGASTGFVSVFKESGWHYLSIDTSAYKGAAWDAGATIMQFYISDRDGAAFGYDATDYRNITGNFTFYVDDITVDYSSAVDDREAPVFASVRYADETMSDAAELKGNTTAYSTLSFGAVVHENTAKSNYTGLDESTAKAYIDGIEVDCAISGGIISVDSAELTNGTHTIKFSICDKMGNYASEIRTIVVNAPESKNTIKLVPHDAALDRILFGSVYYMDLVADSLDNVKSVTTSIDLDNLSTWELDHMIVAEGFEAEYSIQEDDNIATLTFTRTAAARNTSGEEVLASLPVRVWTLKTGYNYTSGNKAGQPALTLAQFKNMKEFWAIALIAEVDMGLITYTDDTSSTFTGERVFVDTEMWAEDADMIATESGLAYYNSWNGGHLHTEKATDDCAATCTENGYTGRTYCEGCSSVVNWGTVVPATGHTYETIDGVRKCACGELFNGTYEGVDYIDGVPTSGWIGDSYYVDGVKLTGLQKIDGYYYNFDENGICAGQQKYTGLFEENGNLYYSVAGSLRSGWTMLSENGEDVNYYFDPATNAAVDGFQIIDDVKYEFRDHKLYNGEWRTTSDGKLVFYWAGKLLCNRWFTLRGETYHFDQYCYAATGTMLVKMSTGGSSQMFVFSDKGVLLETVTSTGLYVANGVTYCLVDGIAQRGVQEVDGEYYYFSSSYKQFIGAKKYVDENASNGIVTPGYCWFDVTDGTMLHNEFADPENTGKQAYYTKGRPAASGQWVEENGKKYYLTYEGVPVKGAGWVDGVYYYFDEVDGHLCDYEFIIRDNTMYYCIGGLIQKLGLVEIDGYTYYISTTSGRVIRDCGYWVSGNKNPTGVDQLYYFDENGHRRDEEFFTVDGNLYYMQDGKPAKLGLFEVEGNLYYASTNSGAVKFGKVYVEAHNANGREGNCYYYFAADGKAINNAFYKDGSAKYYLVAGRPQKTGLTEIDGDLYYLSTNSGAVKTGRYYVEEKNANGLKPAGWYTFDAEGKLIG